MADCSTRVHRFICEAVGRRLIDWDIGIFEPLAGWTSVSDATLDREIVCANQRAFIPALQEKIGSKASGMQICQQAPPGPGVPIGCSDEDETLCAP
jgi:hypothetical protein